jgi:hypothetical protein
MKAAPAVRMRSAISSAGGVTGAPPPNRDPHLYQNRLAITAPFILREASAAGQLRPNSVTGKVAPSTCMQDSPIPGVNGVDAFP